MASLINSIRNLTSDQWWFVKIGIYAGALSFILNQGYYIPPRLTDDKIQIFLMGLFFLFMGIASVTINRNINNKAPIFPGFLDIFEILIKGIFSSIAIIPGLLLSYITFNYIQTFTFESMFVLITIYVISAAILSAFIFIPVVLVSIRGNLFDLFRLDILFKGAGNYIVQFLSYLIQYIVIIGSITALLYYFLLEMLGDHFALLYLKSLVIVISFFSIFSYSSDLYGDSIPEIKFNTKTKKKLSKEEIRARKQEKIKKEEEKRKNMYKNHYKHKQNANINDNKKPKTHNNINETGSQSRPKKIVRPQKQDD